MAVADLDGEVLGHLPAVDHGADRQADLGGAAQRRVLAADLRLNAGQLPFGRRQQVLALARALGGKVAVAADDQPFAGEQLGGADLGEVAVVEQRQLQRPVLGRQRLNGRRSQAGNPIEAGRLADSRECGPR